MKSLSQEFFLEGVQGEVLVRLERFYKDLAFFNRTHNLISRHRFKATRESLLRESLFLSRRLESFFQEGERVLDLGTGNGFPGLIFAILFPQTQFFLCDRNSKKIEFLKQMQFRLGLKNVRPLGLDARRLSDSYPRILSKSMGRGVFHQIERLLSPGGKAILWKNSSFQLPDSRSPLCFQKRSYQIQGRPRGLLFIEKPLSR